MTERRSYRLAVALALGAALLMLWGIGAVGIIGAEGDRADLLFLGVLAIGLVGALAARFRARGMAVALAVTAAATVVVGIVALAAGLGPVNPRIEIVGLTGMFAGLFAASAWLFRRAA